MSFFRRKEQNEIPFVADPIASRNELLGSSNNTSPRQSTASTYVASRDDDSYKPSDRYNEAPTNATEDKYRRNAAVGDDDSHGGGKVETDQSNRLGRATTYGQNDEEGIGGSGRFKTAEQLNARKEQRKRYRFEADDEDDVIEDELDDNLDEISDMTKKRLKALVSAMHGKELDKQIEHFETKTLGVDIYSNTKRLQKIK